MTFLERFVGTPAARAIGWTLLDSLWQGAILAVLFAAVLVAIRSPRIRYAAACAAVLAMLAGFFLTLVWLLPEQAPGAENLQAPAIPVGNLFPASVAVKHWTPPLTAIAPWLGPFWITGVCLFCLRYLASWISAQRMRRRGVCGAPDRWQRELARLSAALRISRPVELVESCLADVPVVLGHFRPLILVPSDYLPACLPRRWKRSCCMSWLISAVTTT